MSSSVTNRGKPDAMTISMLVDSLKSENDVTRHDARMALVLLEKAAVPFLVLALQDVDRRARWEAAKALDEIGDSTAVPALVNALNDEDSDVRWVAADSLIKQSDAALVPLLYALKHHADSVNLRDSARHVLHRLQMVTELKPVLAGVIDALDGVEPALSVPFTAQRALDELTKSPGKPQ